MSLTKPFRSKFSPVSTSEDGSVEEFEGSLPRSGRSFVDGIAWKMICLSAMMSPILLLLLVLNLRLPLHADDDHQTRRIFGDIPWVPRTFEDDERFVQEDPYEGKAFSFYNSEDFDFERQSTVWDDLYPGNMIAIETPQKFGLSGGVVLDATVVMNSTEFASGSHAFGLAFLHQIHCVGAIKHYTLLQKQGKVMTAKQFQHTDHCLERIRQLVVCKADLTVQHPKMTALGNWHPQHICRDEGVLMAAVKSRTIVKTDGKWAWRYRKS